MSRQVVMATTNVKINTFFPQKQKTNYVDSLSMLYIGAANILGLNRLPVILNQAKYILTSLAVVYCIFLAATLIYSVYKYVEYESVAVIMNFTEYIFCVTFSFITWKRIERYYGELNKFDIEIGCRPKVTTQAIRNLIVTLILSVIFPIVYLMSLRFGGKSFDVYRMPLFFLNCLELVDLVELHYYGHLLSLLVPRLRLILYFVELELSNGKSATCPNVDKFVSFKSKHVKNTQMKKLMDLYYIVIQAYDFLNDAIKWQFLVILIATFISTLNFCYHFAGGIINAENLSADMLINLGSTVAEMFPLFSPCFFCDRVHGEVRRLRELLASRLYENKLDKPGRSAARALLALTEARDLSFSLLRMLRVDMSLPFKFIGLLVTYLIILLQFEKVINPPISSNKTELVE